MADEYGQNGQAGGGFGPPPPPNGPGVPPGTPPPPPGPPPAAPPPAGPPPGMPQQQAGGGYVPQQQPMGMPVPQAQPGGPHPHFPAPPPPRSGGGAKAVGIVLSVLLVLAVLGGGAAVVLLSGDDSGSSGTEQDELPSNALEQLWSTPLQGTHVASGDASSLPGLWPVGSHVVYGDERGGMRAYDAESGDEMWKVKKPKHAGELCAMSRALSPGGIGAVAFDAGGDCAYLAAVEVDTGTLLWDKNLAGDVGTSNPVLTVNDDTISTNIGMYVNNWTAKGGAPGMDFTSRGQDCDSTLVLGNNYAVGSSECTDVSPRHQLTVLDTRGGDAPWRFPGVDLQAQRILGENPLTVLLQDDEENQFVQSFSDDGKQGKLIPLTGKLDKLQFEADYTYVTEDRVLVTEYGDNVHFAAVDLKTGELLWNTPKSAYLQMIGYDSTDGRLIAAAKPDEGFHLDLTEYDVRTGETTVIGALAVKGQSMGSPSTASWAWDGSTVYMVADNAKGQAVLRAFRGTA